MFPQALLRLCNSMYFPNYENGTKSHHAFETPCFCFSAIAARFLNEESEKLFPSRSTPILSLPLILPQVDSKLVQALHSFVSHTAIFLSCTKRNHLQARASKVSSKNDWEKEKRAKVIIIWGQAEL